METTQKSPPLGRPSDRFFDLLELFLGQLWKLLQPVHSPTLQRWPADRPSINHRPSTAAHQPPMTA
ncbi:hypothetical protein [Azospirillum doebereinerae]|uniref:hypothetical protein n=1 Tax=Azospirillum doebereinerae TaxID=92933 RepID=UPI00163CD259|nr:hypothetical protein [Azospirillum doebereinerae]